MTDAELIAFTEWLRRRYVLARIDRWTAPDGHLRSGVIVESISNDALVDAYREHAKTTGVPMEV